jgi:hypothetical protein
MRQKYKDAEEVSNFPPKIPSSYAAELSASGVSLDLSICGKRAKKSGLPLLQSTIRISEKKLRHGNSAETPAGF